MGKTNWKRVFLGGVLTGIEAIVLGFASWEIFLDRTPAMEALGLLGRSSEGLIILGIVIYIVAGIIAIWTYSKIRLRYSGRLRTAVMAGIVFWILSVLFPYIYFGVVGRVPTTIPVVDGLIGLVICIVATMVGAWVYKERPR